MCSVYISHFGISCVVHHWQVTAVHCLHAPPKKESTWCIVDRRSAMVCARAAVMLASGTLASVLRPLLLTESVRDLSREAAAWISPVACSAPSKLVLASSSACWRPCTCVPPGNQLPTCFAACKCRGEFVNFWEVGARIRLTVCCCSWSCLSRQ